MKAITLFGLLLLVAAPSFAQDEEKKIPANSKVFIEPMGGGFETYLAAAFDKKKTPLLIVAGKEQADFIISGNSEMQKAGWAKTIFGSGRPAVNASIQVMNAKTSIVAYAVASHKGDAWAGYKSAAEHIAKNLKAKIERDAKSK